MITIQYAITTASNHEQIKKDSQRTSRIKPPSHIKDQKNFELNNRSFALNILFLAQNSQEIKHAHKSKNNLNRENKVIILMITDIKKQHYLAVKKLLL